MDYVWIGLYIVGVMVLIGLWDWLMIYPDRTIYSERMLNNMWFDLRENKTLYYRMNHEAKLWKQIKKRSG